MLEPVLFGSKILFLLLLYFFIFMIVRRLAHDLRNGAEPIAMPLKPETPLAVPARNARPAVKGPAAPAPPVAQPRERMPIKPEPAIHTDASTSEFDYLTSKLKPRLVVQHSKVIEDGKVFEIRSGATIGRSPRSQVVLPDEYVSQTHARIFARRQFLFLEDLGSTNGTYIDGRRIEGEHQIKPGQEIVIGDTIFRFEE